VLIVCGERVEPARPRRECPYCVGGAWLMTERFAAPMLPSGLAQRVRGWDSSSGSGVGEKGSMLGSWESPGKVRTHGGIGRMVGVRRW
jgi:hypothetical protein